jgi:hypothetical protein
MRRGRAVFLVLLVTALGYVGCGKNAATFAAWFGATDKPQLVSVTIDILCDASSGSTCTPDALREVTQAALREAAERPGSTVRLWMQGRNIETTRLVAVAKSPMRRVAGRRARADAEDHWVAKECASLSSAAANASRKRMRRSPIAESIGIVGLAPPPASGKREIIAVTDALEVSDYGEFECGRLPKPERFARSLTLHGVLPPGSLAGIAIRFCHVDLGAIDGGRCAVSLGRAAEIRAIWRAALTAAGASTVEIRSGGIESETISGKETINDQENQSE